MTSETLSPETYKIQTRVNSGIANTRGVTNIIQTTKYSILSWLPKSILEQFRRIANLYFLLISIMMIIGTYATYLYSTPLDYSSTLFTLIFVLLVTSIKEGVEDLQRARADKFENTKKVTVIRFNSDKRPIEEIIESKNIKAGDIIKLQGHLAVPVDMVILMTSQFADANQCYTETSNIDGETNLKLRQAPPQLKLVTSSGDLKVEVFRGFIDCEPPNKNIHDFIGALLLDEVNEPISLCAENMLLRGSIFCNTEWAYGIAVYTGQECKVQMNNKLAVSKMSTLEKYVNFAIIIIFFAQCIIVSVTVISLYGAGYNNLTKFPYIYPSGKNSSSILPLWLETWFVVFLLYNNFIPISLYVTLELVNLGQAYLVSTDMEIYDPVIDSPCIVRSSNQVQELGCVCNVFSDKTGTLTRNEMKFVKFMVTGRTYDVEKRVVTDRGNVFESPVVVSMRDPEFSKSPLYKFLHCLTLCHTIVRESDGTYRSESPDELALVEGVGKFNCSLLERGSTSMTIEMCSERMTVQILAINAFNAFRKRMSILIYDAVSGEYILYLKGADSAVLDLCKLSKNTRDDADKDLLSLACIGLRTLCVARRVMDANTATQWLSSYKVAQNSLQNRGDQLDAVAAVIEQDMELLGITAIEDRLQDEVPEVIADLAKAGIVVWMLTGDKEETAINIGHSCNLLREDTTTFTLTKINTLDEYNTKLKEVHEALEARAIGNGNAGHTTIQTTTGNRSGRVTTVSSATECALVMDGPSFKYFDEENLDHRRRVLRIGQLCRSIIACRLTPLQKQQLVGLVKTDTKPKAITLAIGDGANDVSMIREADVGVGIIGKEGRQAANNADFAIGQFKFLKRLLLVHGRWNYMRQCRVFLYSMHKNMVITLTLFWYSYLDAQSGTSIYNSWIYSGFNIALGLPIIVYGILNQDIAAGFAMAHPEVYCIGMSNALLDTKAIAIWIFNACFYATVICLLYYNASGPTFSSYELYEMGTFIFIGMVMALQAKVIFLHSHWTYISTIAMGLSIFGTLIFILILTSMTGTYYDYSVYGVATSIYNNSYFWFYTMFTVPIFCLLIDVVGQALLVYLAPTKEILYREQDNMTKDNSNTISGRIMRLLPARFR